MKSIDFSFFKKRFDEGNKNGLKNSFTQIMQPSFTPEQEDTIDILYIGHCFQESFLLPFLENLNSKYPNNRINVYTIKNDIPLEVFDNASVEHGILVKEQNRKIVISNEGGKNFEIKLIQYNKENIHYFPVIKDGKSYKDIPEINLNSNQESLYKSIQSAVASNKDRKNNPVKFDTIFCCFELHLCVNWRYSAINLLEFLNNKGVFIFAEVSGEISLFDGNFPEGYEKKNKATFDLFKTIYDLRTNYHYWNPEISFTNHIEVKNFLIPFFNEHIEKIEAVGSEDGEPRYEVSFEELKNHFINGDFSYFSVGLKREERETLWQKLEKNLGVKAKSNTPINLRYGFNLYFASNFNYNKFTKNEIPWNYSTFSKNIQRLYEFNKDKLIAKSLDIFAHHDIIFPRHSVYTGFFSWKNAFSTLVEPVHLLVNPTLFNGNNTNPIEKMIGIHTNSLFLAETQLQTSFFELILKNPNLKFPVIFQLLPDEDKSLLLGNSHLSEIGSYHFGPFDKNEKEWICYRLNHDKKGEITNLTLAFSESFGQHLKINPEEYEQLKKTLKNKEKLRNQKIESRKISKKFISKLNFTYTEKIELPQKDTKKQVPIESQIILDKVNDFWKDIQLYNTEPYEEDEYGKNYLIKLLKLIYNFQLKYPNYQFAFYPSKVSENTDYYDDEGVNERYLSLGGLFSFDYIIGLNNNPSTRKMYKLMEARNKVLNRVSNLILYKASLINYVSQDFREHARKAAIAAISARNVSHNIGSHVIPHIRTGSLTSKENNPLLKEKNFYNDYNLLLGYIQQRNDFINQLTSGSGGWTISVWFVKELMARFYKQYFLLSSIAAYEGLKIYNYQYFEKYYEFDWSTIEEELQKKASASEKQDGEILVVNTISIENISDYQTNRVSDFSIKSENYNQLTINFKENFWQEHKEFEHIEDLADFKTIFRKQTSSKFEVIGKIEKTEAGKFQLQNARLVERIWALVHGFLYIDGEQTFISKRLNGKKIEISFKDKIWTNYAKHEQAFYDILKSQNKRKFKVKGLFKKIDGKWRLTDAEFVENYLIIKVRKRKFYHQVIREDKGGKSWKSEEQSKFISKTYCINISEQNNTKVRLIKRINKAKKHINEQKNNQKLYFYGIIEKINVEESNLKFFFEEDLIVEIKTLQASLKLFPFNNYLKPGKRIVVEGNFDEETFTISNAEIVEYVVVNYMILPTSLANHELLAEDLKIAIPGGISGFQAFYTILENIIRNAAKHNWIRLPVQDKIGKNLEIKIEIEDQDNKDYFICKVWANGADLRFKNGIPKYDENHKLEQTDCSKENKSPNNLEDAINKKLNKVLINDIIDSDGKFIMEYLGSAEIKVNAAYLASKGISLTSKRMMEGEEILLKDKNAKSALKGYIKASQINEYVNGEIVPRLGYRFKLQKPKELCLIGNNKDLSIFQPIIFGEKSDSTITPLTNKEGLEKEKKGGLDYDFCVLILEDEDKQNFDEPTISNLIVNILLTTFKIEEKVDSLDRAFDELFERIENYPYRLFLYLPNEIKYLKMFEQLKNSLTMDNHLYSNQLLFILQRVYFLTFKQWEPIQNLSLVPFQLINIDYKNPSDSSAISQPILPIANQIFDALKLAFGGKLEKKNVTLDEKLKDIQKRLDFYPNQLFLTIENTADNKLVLRNFFNFWTSREDIHGIKRYDIKDDHALILEEIYRRVVFDIDMQPLQKLIAETLQLTFNPSSRIRYKNKLKKKFEKLEKSLQGFRQVYIKLNPSFISPYYSKLFAYFWYPKNRQNFKTADYFHKEILKLKKSVYIVRDSVPTTSFSRYQKIHNLIIEIMDIVVFNRKNQKKYIENLLDEAELLMNFFRNVRGKKLYFAFRNAEGMVNKIQDTEYIYKQFRDDEIYRKFKWLLNKIEIIPINRTQIQNTQLDENEFSRLKIYLYDAWTKLLGGKRRSYNLEIIFGNDEIDVENENIKEKNNSDHPPSLPMVLRNQNIKRKNIKKKTTSTNQKKSYDIVYVRHKAYWKNKFPSYHFVEILSGKKMSFNHFESLNNNSRGSYYLNKFELLLKENANSSILIVDERIMQYYAQANSRPDDNCYKNFLNQNIFVPVSFEMTVNKEKIPKIFRDTFKYEKDLEFYNKENFFGDESIRLEFYYIPSFRDENHQGEVPYINTIIIHQSILDKAIELKKGKEKEEIAKKIITTLKKQFPSVIVTSGRNKSPLFSKYSKFLPFSALEELVMTENPDKLTLTQILFKTLR